MKTHTFRTIRNIVLGISLSLSALSCGGTIGKSPVLDDFDVFVSALENHITTSQQTNFLSSTGGAFAPAGDQTATKAFEIDFCASGVRLKGLLEDGSTYLTSSAAIKNDLSFKAGDEENVASVSAPGSIEAKKIFLDLDKEPCGFAIRLTNVHGTHTVQDLDQACMNVFNQIDEQIFAALPIGDLRNKVENNDDLRVLFECSKK